MKILHVINSLDTGGAEKLIIDTLPKYRDKGIDVDLAVMIDEDYPFMVKLKKTFSGNIFILGNKKVYNMKAIPKLYKLTKNYDIVHVHLFPCQYFVYLAATLSRSNFKLIFTEHNTNNRRRNNKILNPLEKVIYNKYDKIICITNEVQDLLHKHVQVPFSKLPIINNGVDLSNINSASPIPKEAINPNIKEHDYLITQVAGFRDQKDQPTLIRSLEYLPCQYKVLLVGDGKHREYNEALASELNLSNRVFFLGKREDVPEILKTSDFVVLSSKHEGLSLSSIEGLASGVPFIASDVPGLSNIVKGYGEVFTKGNAKELADKILFIHNNPEYRESLIKKSIDRSMEFDISNMVNKHIELYKELIR